MSNLTTSSVANLNRELDLALEMVRGAGAILSTFYEVPPEVQWKASDEPVTEADRAANAYVVGQITQTFPQDGILAEESVDNLDRIDKTRVWMVDPLDGTHEFIAHNGEFCVMIGFVIEGRPALGVIYQPVGDMLYGAAPGVGAFSEQFGVRSQLRVSDVIGLSDLRPVVSRSHRSPLVDPINQALGVQRERLIGSIGLKTMALALGQADFYIHPSAGPKEWDTCAPEAILVAAGGTMTDCWNRPLRYNQRDIRRQFGVLASNRVCHEGLIPGVLKVLDEAGIDPDFGFK